MKNASFPFALHWDPQQLADAVPLRLFEALDFQAVRCGESDASANDARGRHAPASYLPRTALRPFRVG
jgi:hypothetical protein